MPSKGGSAAARRFWFPHRPDAPGPVPAAEPGRRIDGDPFAVDDDAAAPGAQLREALRIQGHPVAGAQDVRLFLDDVEQALPGEIGRHTFGFVEHDTQFSQRLDDLHPVTVDVLV